MDPIDDDVLRAAFGPAAPAGADEPWRRWAHAVLLGARGRYAAAETLLHGLRGDPSVPAVLRAHASVTRASHLRQAGAHAAAARLDAAAVRLAVPHAAVPSHTPAEPNERHHRATRRHERHLRSADGDERDVRAADVCGLGPAAALGDALTGLAADAVGRWDPASATRLLVRAAPWCGVRPDSPDSPDTAGPGDGGPGPGPVPPAGRTAVRWHWVRAETSLLSGDADGAVRAARTACVLADGLGSPRHRLKSRLVLAVARAAATAATADAGPAVGPDRAGGPDRVAGPDDGVRFVAELDALADEAAATGLPTLRWPALLAAADAVAADAVGGGGATTPDRSGPNERHAGPSRSFTMRRQTVAQSRRHAAMVTLNVVYLHSDPVIRRSMRESAWLPARGAVPY